MNKRLILTGMAVVAPLLVLAASLYGLSGLAYAQGPLGTGFTYQGRLTYDGGPITDTCDMAFRLYDDGSSGSQVGDAITTSVAVTRGLFTVPLDFGSEAFAGEARWLGIRVDCGDGYADLGRQALTAAPYALYAASTGALHGRAVSTTAPSDGQVLAWDAASNAWTPTSPWGAGPWANARPCKAAARTSMGNKTATPMCTSRLFMRLPPCVWGWIKVYGVG